MTEWIELTDQQAVAIAQSKDWEIQVDTGPHWEEWKGTAWMNYMTYRARPRQPKMKTVKMLCYFTGLQIVWRAEDYQLLHGWSRIPAQDIEIEVPEDR